MKGLIVTADDFGAAREVNEAVARAHTGGILCAASLMVGAPAASEAVALAKRLPSLRVGLHIVLVDGTPVLPPSEIPDLVDETGRFRTGMARAGARIFFQPKVRRQLEAEIEAQFSVFAKTGLVLDHVNAHKHFHLHPTIARAILRIGKGYGMTALRVPCEPRLNFSAPHAGEGRIRTQSLAGLFAARLRRRVRAKGIAAPDQVFGLAWSGAMTKDRLLGLLTHLPDGLSEIYLHPATGPYPGSAPGYLYAEELAALTEPRVIAAVNDLKCGGFLDFKSDKAPDNPALE